LQRPGAALRAVAQLCLRCCLQCHLLASGLYRYVWKSVGER
jgi:hypothetical protein